MSRPQRAVLRWHNHSHLLAGVALLALAFVPRLDALFGLLDLTIGHRLGMVAAGALFLIWRDHVEVWLAGGVLHLRRSRWVHEFPVAGVAHVRFEVSDAGSDVYLVDRDGTEREIFEHPNAGKLARAVAELLEVRLESVRI